MVTVDPKKHPPLHPKIYFPRMDGMCDETLLNLAVESVRDGIEILE